MEIIDFKRKIAVPKDKTRSAWLASMDPRFDVVKGILYYVDSSKGGKLRMVVRCGKGTIFCGSTTVL